MHSSSGACKYRAGVGPLVWFRRKRGRWGRTNHNRSCGRSRPSLPIDLAVCSFILDQDALPRRLRTLSWLDHVARVSVSPFVVHGRNLTLWAESCSACSLQRRERDGVLHPSTRHSPATRFSFRPGVCVHGSRGGARQRVPCGVSQPEMQIPREVQEPQQKKASTAAAS